MEYGASVMPRLLPDLFLSLSATTLEAGGLGITSVALWWSLVAV